MAEHNKGGILNKAGRILSRKKTLVLQSLGKQEKTTDEILAEDCHKLDKQQEVANKFQKDLRNYIHCARALSVASKTFYTTVSEAYEPEWENHAQITEILTNMDMLWQDYLQKLQEQVQEPLSKYLATIPQIKARIAKRGRKLIDYDNAKHGLEVHQNARKKDEAKIAKAQEDLEQAKKIYEDLNNELHQELPEFYLSRVRFYGDLFQSLFTAENVFQSEAGKGSDTIVESADKLSKDHEHCTYTPRKNLRHTVVIGRPMMRSDENLTNGHPENGQTESPNSSSPSSPTSPATMNATVNLTNGNNEADTSKESMDAYEPTKFQENNEEESKNEQKDETEVKADVEAAAEKPADVAEVKPDEVEEKPSVNEKEQVEEKKDVVEDSVTETVQETVPETKAEESKPKEEEEVKVNGDLDTSVEQEVPDDAPPPVPVTPPPAEAEDKADDGKNKVDNAAADDDKDDTEQNEDVEDDNLYQVPPPAKPVEDDLPPNYCYTENQGDSEITDSDDDDLPENFLFKVVATHAYKGEDDDELTLDAGEVIYVVSYEDPEEQDPGWLMGVRKINRQMGVFPENFTKRVSSQQAEK